MGFAVRPLHQHNNCTASAIRGASAATAKPSKHSERVEQVIEKCVANARRRRRDEQEWQLVFAESPSDRWVEIERPQ